MTYQFLDTYWNYGFAVFAFIAGAFIFHRFSFNKRNPFWSEAASTFVFVSFLIWVLSFAAMTRIEIDALNTVFIDEDLPGRNISFALAAILFGVLFALIVIFYRNVLVCGIIIFFIGISDIYGNQSMAKAMQLIQFNVVDSGRVLDPVEKIWIWYYLELPHPQRISIYMSISALAIILFVFSKFKSLRLDYLDSEFGRRSRKLVDLLRNNWIFLDITSRIMLASCVLINEYSIYSWRYERELRLERYDSSIYFEFANDWSDYMDTISGEFRSVRD